jgi:hypothetical protein
MNAGSRHRRDGGFPALERVTRSDPHCAGHLGATATTTVALAIVAASILVGSAHAQTRIDQFNINFRWLGPDDRIVVERYDDPRVQSARTLGAGRQRQAARASPP